MILHSHITDQEIENTVKVQNKTKWQNGERERERDRKWKRARKELYIYTPL